MKKISQKIAVALAIVAIPTVAMAQTNTSPTELIKQMQTLLDQYAQKIQILEAENNLLRSMMAKHEIQIPLEEYTKIYNNANSVILAPIDTKQLHASTPAPSTVLPASTDIPKTPANTVAVNAIQKAFIDQINKDWEGIRGAYVFPANAWIGGYEFVKNAAGNNVFVDVVFGSGTPEGAYNAKLLYEFNKTNYSRKLLGLFIYNSDAKAYVTHRGSNPFAGVEREIIRVTPNSTTTIGATSTTAPATSAPAPAATPAPVNSAAATEMENKITSLYQAKNYSQVLSVSDAYLKSNAPTYKILQLRYRSYFILGQYTKALTEVQKMETAKLATAFSYCEAYAIAMHAKNQALANKYKGLAGVGCSTTGS